ncbi:hypothetical protein [uncultured Gammaproteobacteria bacterium]|nr:hypothetical protein BROOK1789B_1517 [Bathymodiolus brooksi thiotrophic gill symbiont]CAC9561115.1 hypothetical protein [uncultured Gammaproteobacteria bacterium]CAC9615874.1 hypothetical protein [uncultured Gammaproteobacteria bacterium]CAC9963601.1 hypothetical protein [uncultured Gammaproteobacteria bacterium]
MLSYDYQTVGKYQTKIGTSEMMNKFPSSNYDVYRGKCK